MLLTLIKPNGRTATKLKYNKSCPNQALEQIYLGGTGTAEELLSVAYKARCATDK